MKVSHPLPSKPLLSCSLQLSLCSVYRASRDVHVCLVGKNRLWPLLAPFLARVNSLHALATLWCNYLVEDRENASVNFASRWEGGIKQEQKNTFGVGKIGTPEYFAENETSVRRSVSRSRPALSLLFTQHTVKTEKYE